MSAIRIGFWVHGLPHGSVKANPVHAHCEGRFAPGWKSRAYVSGEFRLAARGIRI